MTSDSTTAPFRDACCNHRVSERQELISPRHQLIGLNGLNTHHRARAVIDNVCRGGNQMSRNWNLQLNPRRSLPDPRLIGGRSSCACTGSTATYSQGQRRTCHPESHHCGSTAHSDHTSLSLSSSRSFHASGRLVHSQLRNMSVGSADSRTGMKSIKQ